MPEQIKIDAKQLVQTVAEAAFGHGLVPGTQKNFVEQRGDKHIIAVVAAPKSGSTFLANTLGKLTGYGNFRLCSGYGTNEHDLYLPALCLINRSGCVSQLHMKGSFHNAALMKAFGIKPIILVRQIDDTVVSLRKDLRKKESMPGYGTGQNGYSFIWQDIDTKNLSDEELTDAIIDLAIPWYVNFYASWYRLCEQGAVNAQWVNYKGIFSDTENTLQTLLSFQGINSVDKVSPELLTAKYATFQQGGEGAGAAQLSSPQRERIRRLFSYYKGIDFEHYGL
ncbi:MAG: hypothetical protein ACI9JM_002444 [Halioglobus sp.]|jgi:hypothetical protein